MTTSCRSCTLWGWSSQAGRSRRSAKGSSGPASACDRLFWRNAGTRPAEVIRMQRQRHWNAVYDTKSAEQVSWFEALPLVSLRMLESAGLTTETCVVDIGGGD